MMSLEDVQSRIQLWNETYAYLRAFFEARGYAEVRTPLLVRHPGMEPNLDPVGANVHVGERNRTGLRSVRAGLITSPEYAMKKLLGAGMERIYTVTPVFRDKEYLHGQHGIEFTMLEWYRQGADYTACMEETQELVNGFLGLEGEWPRVSYVAAFQTTFGVHPADIRTIEELQALLHDWNKGTASGDLSESIGFAFQTLVLPEIMRQHDRFFLTEFPVPEASLAQKNADGRSAQRFEAYVQRMEICNGFTELVDPAEQRLRFQEEQEQRKKAGKEVFPIDEELLSRLSSVASPSFGNALGIDRLIMLKTDTQDIDSIHLFPPSERFN